MRTVCNAFLAAWLFILAPDTASLTVFWVKISVAAICFGLSVVEGAKLAKCIREVRVAFDNQRRK